MAQVKADGTPVHFDPYSENPKDHFERVTKDIYNALGDPDDIRYRKYVEFAGDRSVNAATKKDLKQFKKGVESDLNRIISSRGVGTLNEILSLAEEIDATINWDLLKRITSNVHEVPDKPDEPDLKDIPREPEPEDRRFQPNFGLLDYLLPFRKQRKRDEMEEKFEKVHSEWEEEKQQIESENEQLREDYREHLENWEEKKREAMEDFEQLRKGYNSGEKKAVEMAVGTTLMGITYPSPDAFQKLREVFDGEVETTFKPEAKVLIVDRSVPPPEEIPRRKKIKYVKSRDAFKGKDLSKRDFNQLYESIPYQIALRTAHEVFSMDAAEVIETVVFNGWVTSVNPATGHEETVCTLSLQASREEIAGLNLSQVDPKAAFKNLKGVSASKLREKSPVTPIVQADRSDSRFTEGRDVGEDMESGENIAAMDWEDFEHLIRELFESEFAEEGGEVNVTQASRDGGIDAVAFDPDPLRGGKIVIQAKRYTQTVGVSAVRDLYGTVMNEGASRGILVTTSDYGSGAYDFAKDKPLQLLDGGNLLSLLEQHGYDARIDVEEARNRME